MAILAYIDPEPHEDGIASEIAAALADYCMATDTDLALVCDASTAIEVGLAAIQAYEPRTVEGAERRTSSVSIVGLIEREDEFEWFFGEARYIGDQEPIEQLRDLGAFRETDLTRRPA